MVLRYWGERGLDAESFAHLVDRSAAGIRTAVLLDDLRGRGWNASGGRGSPADLSEALSGSRPVVALIEDRPGTFHYVVIVAMTPRLVVLHDPARAPFQVSSLEAFERRWAATDHWMMVVTSRAPAAPPTSIATAPSVEGSACDLLVADGIRHAQAGNLDLAERRLTSALTCGGSAPLRELAGVRLLQRRWPEVDDLAAEAVQIDPDDGHAWDLLAASRFVHDDVPGALEAWNRIDQPRVDLVSVDGLTRTRHRIVERLLAVRPRSLLTTSRFTRARRRLADLPSASATKLEVRPASSGLVEVRAHVIERPLVPTDPWGYAAMGLLAAARNEVSVSTGALAGGGERLSTGWRFWPGRPGVRAELLAPAPWGGLWSVDGFWEQESFDGRVLPPATRRGAGLAVANWVSPWARLALRGGVENRREGTMGALSGSLHLAPSSERVTVRFDTTAWMAEQRFASVAAVIDAKTSDDRRRRVVAARGGAAVTTKLTPADLWLAGDTGRVRDVLLRAHPLVAAGGLDLDRMGRSIIHGSAELQHWWRGPLSLRLAAAGFADSARVGSRPNGAAIGDLDIGIGLRVALPFLPGVFRVDMARGLRDEATALSFAYAP
jgi:hypothetical protein